MTILDCTLRDGGYYTNWEFDTGLVEEYLAACPGLGIDVVELGYARFDEGGFGPYGRLPAGLTPNLRAALPDGHRLRFAVMVDAADFAHLPAAEVGPRLAATLAGGSLPVELVRVAVHYRKAAGTAEAVASLRAAGFGVCLNLMQIDLATPAELDACVAATASMGPLEAVYVADSLGSLRPERTAALVRRFVAGQSAPVGIHAHENQGLALHNTMVAADAGATWLDATVHGMGRGAGNTRTEHLLAARGADPETLRPLFDLIARHFHRLADKYRWGASAFYLTAGVRRIHPSYVQRLEESAGLDAEAELRALEYLAEAGASAFSTELLERAVSHARA